LREILLTQGKVALVDDADYDYLMQWKWRAVKEYKRWYAVRSVRKNGERFLFWMHRVILNTPVGMETDHINHNGLDNQRSNIRICNHSENLHNQQVQKRIKSSTFKGVSWYKQRCMWESYIEVNGKKIRLGYFNDELEAAKTYDNAAIKYFGEFANLNF